jgi:hypothetical protein
MRSATDSVESAWPLPTVLPLRQTARPLNGERAKLLRRSPSRRLNAGSSFKHQRELIGQIETRPLTTS